MLRDLEGVDKNERTMIQASIRNLRVYGKVADALVAERPCIHVNEKRREPSRKGKGQGRRNFGSKGKGKGQFREKPTTRNTATCLT